MERIHYNLLINYTSNIFFGIEWDNTFIKHLKTNLEVLPACILELYLLLEEFHNVVCNWTAVMVVTIGKVIFCLFIQTPSK